MTEASAPAPIGASISDGSSPAVPLVSDAYRRYALVILLAVYTLNFLDRQIVTILASPMRSSTSCRPATRSRRTTSSKSKRSCRSRHGSS